MTFRPKIWQLTMLWSMIRVSMCSEILYAAKGFLSLPRSNAHSKLGVQFSHNFGWITWMIYSCFSHAIAITEGKFLQSLTPKQTKKTSTGHEVQELIVLWPSDEAVGEVNPEVDDEDTEEEIEALVMEVVSWSEFYRSRDFTHPKGFRTDLKTSNPNHIPSHLNACDGFTRESWWVLNHYPHSIHGIMFHGEEIITQPHLDNQQSAKGLKTHRKDW